MALHTELWFPSVVWSGIIHWPDNEAIKTFAYSKKQSDPGRSISNAGGWQSNDILAGEHFAIDAFVANISKEIDQCAQQTGLPKLEIHNIWININPKGAYNKLHDHAGSVLSGVYYVDAEEGQGNFHIERSDNAQYFLPLEPTTVTYFTATATSYKAKTGALYVFPSWLKHSVGSNRLDRDRISISFNFGEAKGEN